MNKEVNDMSLDTNQCAKRCKIEIPYQEDSRATTPLHLLKETLPEIKYGVKVGYSVRMTGSPT